MAIGVNRPPVRIPMAEVLSGDTTVLLSHSWFRGSSLDGVVVEALRPRSVILRFEPIEENRIPLLAPVFGELPEGLSLAGPPEITPAAAIVSGPVSSFEGVESLRLTPMDLSLVGGPEPHTLLVDTAGFPELDILTREASVTFPTEPTIVLEFSDQLLALPVLGSEPQLLARPASVSVVLSGATSLVEDVRPESLRVTISASQANLAPGQEEMVVVVVEGVPEMVSYSVNPEWVLLRRPVGQ